MKRILGQDIQLLSKDINRMQVLKDQVKALRQRFEGLKLKDARGALNKQFEFF